MIIKFVKDHAASGRKIGDVWDTGAGGDEIARAYITAGIAVESAAPSSADILAAARSEFEAGLAVLQKSLTESVASLGRTVGSGLAAVGTGRRFNPRIDGSESEDEKLSRSGGFKNLAHFSIEVQRNGGPTAGLVRNTDTLLGRYNCAVDRVNVSRAVSSPDGMYENSEPDGGALVPPDFTTQIWERLYSTEKLLPRTQGYTVSGNTFVMPANTETSRVDGSRWGGVLGYWEGEAQQLTGSRPKFRDLRYRLKKLTVMSFVTNELLTDSATALEQYLGRVVPQEIEFKIHDALINGTGAGIPLGILNDPALITVAKDTGQATKTISFTNVMNLYNTMWAGSRPNSIWLYNQEIEPQLWQMALPVGTGGVPVFLPSGVNNLYGAGASAPLATLYGRPAFPMEQCPGLGLVGDLILVDLSQYIAISKGTILTAMSIHLKFDYDESVFRWIYRMDGSGAWSAPLTPYKTNLSKTYSFVTALAAR
jgi:HK97 family phage major capsid protein